MDFVDIGTAIGKLVAEKNAAYGDAFGKSFLVLKTLYPDGIKPEQYPDMLGVLRVVDKLFRIANTKDAFDENPWMDIAGYGILGVANSRPQVPDSRPQVANSRPEL